MTLRPAVPLLVLSILAGGAAGAQAQYDRDGRYVPSPNGVPADPNAKIVRGSVGTSATGIGEEIRPDAVATPRGAIIPRIGGEPQLRAPTAVTRAGCAAGWSHATRMSKSVFRARCARLARREGS